MTASWRPPPGVLPDEPRPGGGAVASGKTLDPLSGRGRLVGRGAELDRVDRVLEAARGGEARSLLLVGEAGVGKTSLLTASAARADGFVVTSTRGLESEAPLAQACLLDLLTPLRRHTEAVPLGQAQNRKSVV